jgi:hypothetical protein
VVEGSDEILGVALGILSSLVVLGKHLCDEFSLYLARFTENFPSLELF